MFCGHYKPLVCSGFLLLFLLLQGMVILKVVSVPKPIGSTYASKLTDLWKYRVMHTNSSITFVPFEHGTTPDSVLPSESSPVTTHLRSTEKEILWNSTENMTSVAKTKPYFRHTEKTYKETFVEVPSRDFTDILRKVCIYGYQISLSVEQIISFLKV